MLNLQRFNSIAEQAGIVVATALEIAKAKQELEHNNTVYNRKRVAHYSINYRRQYTELLVLCSYRQSSAKAAVLAALREKTCNGS